jgi:hypothetical protein
MTTAERFRSIAASRTSEVMIAGVPWPRYKVVALVVGFVVLAVVGVVTSSAAATVLTAAAVATVVWVVLGIAQRAHH